MKQKTRGHRWNVNCGYRHRILPVYPAQLRSGSEQKASRDRIVFAGGVRLNANRRHGDTERNIVLLILAMSVTTLFNVFVTHNYRQIVFSDVLLAAAFLIVPLLQRWQSATQQTRFVVGAVGVMIVSLTFQMIRQGFDFTNLLMASRYGSASRCSRCRGRNRGIKAKPWNPLSPLRANLKPRLTEVIHGFEDRHIRSQRGERAKKKRFVPRIKKSFG